MTLLILAGAGLKAASDSARITVVGNQFRVCNGSTRIWMAGGNTPWFLWNDFGNASFNVNTWGNHYQTLIDNKINSSRVWISCSGEVGINISPAGVVGTGTAGSGATAKHWADLDAFFAMAQAKKIYIKATLMSFDHFKSSYSTYNNWRNWINSSSNVDSYISTYLTEFLNRYGSNPYLWSIDLCNEPEWASATENTGDPAQYGGIAWGKFQYAWGKMAHTIHDWNAAHGGDGPLVSVGMGFVKYLGPRLGATNEVSDAILTGAAAGNAANAKLDFWDVHYYLWMAGNVGDPFVQTPNAFFGTALDRPAMLGECPNKGGSDSDPPSSTDGPRTLKNDIDDGYANGWQGMAPWTTNNAGSGNFGDWDNDINDATVPFDAAHPGLLFPSCPAANTATVTPSATRTATRTATPTATRTASATATPSASGTATPSQTALSTRSATRTASATGTPSASATVTPSQTGSVTAASSPSASPSSSPSPTASATRTASPGATASASPSATATATRTASVSASPTPMGSFTESPTPSPGFSASPSATPSWTRTPSATPTPSASSSVSPTPTLSDSASPTPAGTLSDSPTRTASPGPSATHSPSETPSVSPSQTLSAGPSPSATLTPSPSALPTRTPSPGATLSVTPSLSPTPMDSPTLGLPTPAASPTMSPSLSASRTPSRTPSAGPSATPSPAPGDGPLLIEAGVPQPDPNPREVALRLAGPAERIRVKVYTVAWALVGSVERGAAPKGWARIALPAQMQDAANGVYYFVLQAEDGQRKSPPLGGKLMVLR